MKSTAEKISIVASIILLLACALVLVISVSVEPYPKPVVTNKGTILEPTVPSLLQRISQDAHLTWDYLTEDKGKAKASATVATLVNACKAYWVTCGSWPSASGTWVAN